MKFGPYPYGAEAPTLQESFDNGFQTGRNWKENYTPGGPHVIEIKSWSLDKDWDNYCRHTALCHAEWMSGWQAGVNTKRMLERNGL